MSTTLVAPEALTAIAIHLLRARGAPPHAAEAVAEHLVDSNLAGVDSHGIVRLPQYLDLIDRGDIDPAAQLEPVRDAGALLTLEGHHALGPAAGAEGVRIVAERARRYGIATVLLRHIGHAGRMGAYTERIAQHGLIALACCNSPIYGHFVAPPGGREGRLATNPISYAFPTDAGPVVADFSTSSMAEGALRLLRDRGLQAPPDTLIDAQGAPTTDPHALYTDPPGALLPLGGMRLGYKGFALALLVEVLAGTLAGDAVLDSTLVGNNLTLIGIDVQASAAPARFQLLADQLVQYVRAAAPIAADGNVLAPGDKERRTRAIRQQGIPVDAFVWQEISARARQIGYTVPSHLVHDDTSSSH